MNKMIAIAAVSTLVFAQTAQAADFYDTQNHWARDEISVLADKGIVNGVADGWFEPDSEVTRAQYLKMVMGTVGIQTEEFREGNCLDATGSDWFAPYLQSALDKGLIPEQMITGYRAQVDIQRDEEGNAIGSSVKYTGAFNGNIAISREEAAALSMNLYQYTLNANTSARLKEISEELSFNDEEEISSWALPAVKLAASNGIITGMDSGSFEPNEVTTRAQAAVILNRLIKIIEA
jgi:opacity protein-like surface antigen